MKTTWIPVCPTNELTIGSARVFKFEKEQVVLFRLSEDEIYAVNNRCPHEGYPLAQGYVKGCLVTCIWHNYKFDLRDGSCIVGEEAVRTWPLRIRDGLIEIDMTPPAPEVLIPPLLKSLHDGLFERELGRVARDVVRLLEAGLSPERIAFEGARFDAIHAEYGSTHALPLATDVLSLLPLYPGVDAAYPLMQVMDMASDESTVRRAARARPKAVDPGEDTRKAGRRLFALVENEEVEEAEGLLIGALQAGWNRDVIEPWLFELCVEHFLDFGHALIYQIKVFDLIEAIGWDEAAVHLLPSHLFRIANGTREDTLPSWKWFSRRLEALAPQWDKLYRRQQEPKRVPRPDAFVKTILDGEPVTLFEALVDALEQGWDAHELCRLISVAASLRILRFDPSIAFDITVQEGFLHVTHLLTHADAVHSSLKRFESPRVLRLLFFAARFVNKARPLDMPKGKRIDTRQLLARATAPTPDAAGIDEGAVHAAVTARLGDEALKTAASFLATHPDRVEALWRFLLKLGTADRAVRPIVNAHLIKTTIAARQAARVASAHGDHETAKVHLYAALRSMSLAIPERQLSRQVYEAIAFVTRGKVPRRLTD